MENVQNGINAIIVEDEDLGREMLRDLLSENCPEVKVLAEAADITTARKVIQQYQPDLVFLDIKMPHGSAFDLLDKVPEVNFDMIFVTAHNEFAIKALRMSALDYLLKPIDPDELVNAIGRYHQRSHGRNIKDKLALFMDQLELNGPRSVGFPTLDGIVYLDTSEILRCDGDGSYTEVILANGEKQVVSKRIGHVEKLLAAYGFYRVHNSHLVNLSHIRKYVRNGSGCVVLSDGSHVDISRRRREGFLAAMESKQMG